MPDMREDFEAWAKEKWPEVSTGLVDEAYYLPKLQVTWEAWQASRAALKVELPPERDEMFSNSAASEYQATKNQGFNDCLSRVTEALQQAGIEVKHG